MAVDLRPAIAGAARQSLREVGGLDIAVLWMLDRADDSLNIAERPDLLDLFWLQELHLDADRLRDAGIVIVFVHPVAGAREADVGHLAKARIEPGLLFERLVKGDRIFMDLPDRIAEVEQRQQTRRMPGRARGQLLALDQHAVGPALPREMIERRHADDSPANHHSPRVRSHHILLNSVVSGRSFIDCHPVTCTMTDKQREERQLWANRSRAFFESRLSLVS